MPVLLSQNGANCFFIWIFFNYPIGVFLYICICTYISLIDRYSAKPHDLETLLSNFVSSQYLRLRNIEMVYALYLSQFSIYEN